MPVLKLKNNSIKTWQNEKFLNKNQAQVEEENSKIEKSVDKIHIVGDNDEMTTAMATIIPTITTTTTTTTTTTITPLTPFVNEKARGRNRKRGRFTYNNSQPQQEEEQQKSAIDASTKIKQTRKQLQQQQHQYNYNNNNNTSKHLRINSRQRLTSSTTTTTATPTATTTDFNSNSKYNMENLLKWPVSTAESAIMKIANTTKNKKINHMLDNLKISATQIPFRDAGIDNITEFPQLPIELYFQKIKTGYEF